MFLEILADFNLVVQYGIVIRTQAQTEFWRKVGQSAKLPNLIPHHIFFPAIMVLQNYNIIM